MIRLERTRKPVPNQAPEKYSPIQKYIKPRDEVRLLATSVMLAASLRAMDETHMKKIAAPLASNFEYVIRRR